MSASSPTGLDLDPADPDDAKILRRQQRAAKQAGRNGDDRAATTRGRADLEAAYDEGAALAASLSAPAAPQSAPAAVPSTPTRGGRGSGGGRSQSAGAPRRAKAGGGRGWAALRPRSPARPPTRAQDAGGFLAGVALYTVTVIYVRYGPEGWKGWLKAKFLNQPLANGNDASTGGKPKHHNGGSRAV